MIVVALLARCDLHRQSTAAPGANGPGPSTVGWSPYLGGGRPAHDASASFDVAEFAVLDDGSRVLLHHERGFTIGGGSSRDPWSGLTAEMLEREVLTTVLPDYGGTAHDRADEHTGEHPGEHPDEHPYEWLADLCRRQGLRGTADDLRRVPYVVELSEPVIQRLADPSPSED